jgi:hypothetical protein
MPLQQCCSALQVKTALLVTANHTYEFLGCIQYYSNPAQMHSNNPRAVHAAAAVLLCMQVENSLACHCNTPMSFWSAYRLQQPSTDAQQQS